MATIDYTSARAEAARIQQRLNETVASIRSNKSLTDQGRRREMAQATLEARQAAETAKREFAAEREQRRQSLQKIAFGSSGQTAGPEQISMRDAHDRAAALRTPADAKALLARAQLHGDTALAKAVAARAHDRGWTEVVRDYGEISGRQLFIDALDSTASGPRTDTADNIVFRVRAPEELHAASEHELAFIAEQGVNA